MFNLPRQIYGISGYLTIPTVWSLICNFDCIIEYHSIGYFTYDYGGYLQYDDLHVSFNDINYIDFYVDVMAEKLRRKGYWDAFCN